MHRRTVVMASLVAAALALPGGLAAQEAVKVGLILPMTGPFASTGRQVEAAARLFMAQNGDTVAGRTRRADAPGRRRRTPTRPSASRRRWSSTRRCPCLPASA